MLTGSDAERLPELLTVNEVADWLRVTRHAVRDLIAAGRLPAHRVGRRFRVAVPDLRAWLERNQTLGDAAQRRVEVRRQAATHVTPLRRRGPA